jgi:hypothetical protein
MDREPAPAKTACCARSEMAGTRSAVRQIPESKNELTPAPLNTARVRHPESALRKEVRHSPKIPERPESTSAPLQTKGCGAQHLKSDAGVRALENSTGALRFYQRGVGRIY